MARDVDLAVGAVGEAAEVVGLVGGDEVGDGRDVLGQRGAGHEDARQGDEAADKHEVPSCWARSDDPSCVRDVGEAGRARCRPAKLSGPLHSGDDDEDAEPVAGLAKIAGEIGERAHGGFGGGAFGAARGGREEALVGRIHRGERGFGALEAGGDLCREVGVGLGGDERVEPGAEVDRLARPRRRRACPRPRSC